MPITTQLNEKANVKLGTAADSLIAGRKIVSLEESQTSSALQTVISIGTFAVDVANSKNLLVFYDGRILTEGSSNDYTLTSISANNTSNTISLNQALVAGRNIKLLYLGVVVTNSTSIETLSPAINDWNKDLSLTPNAAFGTPLNPVYESRRVGDTLHMKGSFTMGTVTGALATIALPAGITIDATKMSNASNGSFIGLFFSLDPGAGGAAIFSTSRGCVLFYDGINPNVIYVSTEQGAAGTFAKTVANVEWNSGCYASFEFSIPVAGYNSSVIAENSKVFRAADYATNGTNVTTTPDALGEYRTYIKDAAALTATDNAPSGPYTPTNADGFRIDGSVPYASAGTSGQPNRIEIFIGLNKHPEVEAYFGAGRTGSVNLSIAPNTATVFYGVSFDYDPTTGVMIVDATEQAITTTTRFAARSMPTGGTAPSSIGNIYFDINVSDNVLPVQYSDPSKVQDSQVWVEGVPVIGSTATAIWWYPSVAKNIGTDITYVHSTVNGDSFIINTPGLYSVMHNLVGSVQSGVSLNAQPADLTDNILNLINAKVLSAHQYSNYGPHQGGVYRLKKGDVLRAHTNVGATASSNSVPQYTRIIKVSNG